MTYLAIARKYRPATFDEIVGQEHVTRTLRNALTGDRIHHAYLFTGARGVGKTTAARALARALNCDNGPTDTPCGTCTSCVEIAHGSSPDLIEIDGASNNSVEDVREIREAVQYAPSRGRWKIYLVDEVHMLSKGAFNALLKTLEEPPDHVVFVFATTEPNKIPDTILSRVQRFDFKRIPVPKVVDHLATIAEKEGVTVSSNGLRLLARAGEGSMRDAQSLLDQLIAYGGNEISDEQVAETLGLIDRASLHAFLQGLLDGDPAACLAVIDHVYGYGHELSVFTQDLLETLRDATFLGLSEASRKYVDLTDEERDALTSMVDGVSPERLSRLFAAVLEVHEQVKRAGRPRIILEMAVARLATTREAQPVGALLSRLEQVERNLRRGGGPSGGGGGTGRRPSSGGRPSGPPPGQRDRRSREADRRGPSTARSASTREPPSATVAPPPAPEPQRTSQTPTITADRLPYDDAPPADDTGWSRVEVAPADLGELAARPRSTGKVTHRAAANRSKTVDPWQRFVAKVSAIDRRFSVFQRARHVIDDQRVRLLVRGGRDQVEATRAAGHNGVQAAFAECFGDRTMVVEPTQSSRGDSADLERDFLSDPALARIVHMLGAKIERVDPNPDQE